MLIFNLKNILVVSLLTLSLISSVLAETLTPFKFKRYSVEDGLSQGTILSMYQDKIGYLWLGTENGLNRFDGYEFTRINGISGHDVRAITGDSEGNLWVGTTDAVNFRAKNTNQFVSFNSSNQALFQNSNVQSLHLDSNNSLWIGTNKGLYIKESNASVVPVLTKNSPTNLADDFIVSITQINKDHIWLATNEGVFELNTKNYSLKKITLNGEIDTIQIRAIFVNSKKDIWVATFGNGLYRIEHNDKKISHYQAPELIENRVYAMAEDSKGRMWFGMDTQGIQIFEYGKGFHLLTHDNTDPQSISGNAIEKILLSDKGDMWVGTTRTGLNQHNPLSEQFTHLKHRSESLINLPSNDVISIAHDKENNLWVGSFGEGWSVINFKDNTLEYINPQNGLKGRHPIGVVIGNYGYNWLFTESAIIKVDAKTLNIIKTIGIQNDLQLASQPSHPALDANGNIWYTHLHHNLTRFNPVSEEFTHFSSHNSELPSNIIDAILPATNGDVWIANRGGLTLFSAKDNTFTTYSKNKNGENHYVNDLALDSNGQLWIATPNALLQFDTNTKQYLTDDSLLNSSQIPISKLLITSKNTIWASSTDGIYKLSEDSKNLIHFSKEDGLQAGEFNVGVGIILPDGTLAFGGVDGISLFKPSSLTPLNNVIHFSSVSKQTIGGSELLDLSSSLEILALKRDTRALTIYLTTLSYSSSSKIKYRYRINQESWIELPNNILNIPTQNAGQFTYEIAVTDSLGNWQSNNYRKLQIIVPELWYQSNIMVFSYFCLFLVLVFLVIKLRERNIKFEARQLEQEVKERTKDLAQSNQQISKQAQELELAANQQKVLFETISHELRTPITLILGPVQQLRKKMTDTELIGTTTLIERNATRLNRLVNQLLDLSRTESVITEKTGHTNISVLAKNLVSSFKPYASDANIKLTLSPCDDYFVGINLDDAEKLLSNLLSNAIKYSNPNDYVLLSINKDERFVVVTVVDTGIGIKPDQISNIFNRFYRVNSKQTETIEGSGIGLSIVKSIAEKANGSITVYSELNKGTTFTVKLPISSEASSVNQVEPISQKQIIDDELGSNLPHLLLIDDNEDILTYISSVLANDYHITTASNGQDGIISARNTIPDIIISDVMMPGIDGLELLETLKSDELTNHIPIILLTAKGSGESKIEGLKLHADDYISKPFNEDELTLRLRNILDARDIIKKKFAAEIIIEPHTAIKKEKPAFIIKLDCIIEKHYQDSSFSVAELAKEAAVGERQLLRKLKATADVGAKEYIRSYRLKKAAELLHQGNTATLVAAEVGFSSAAYFSNCFKAFYGETPSRYINSTIVNE